MTDTIKASYKVKDISLSDWGRKEIKLAEAEMPGLISLREEFKTKTRLRVLELLAVFT